VVPPTHSAGTYPMELLEREQCLADLAQRLGAVADQGGCIALVGGEAGMGKTALLQEFSKHQRVARVLWGACDALFTPRPLAPLHDIARQTKGALLAAVNSGANREEIFTAALDELERAETLVVFEDMHWADEATLDLLKYLGRRIHRTRAMLVVTYRDDEVGARHPLRFVIGDLPRATTHRMTLSPLTEPAVAQLARQAGRPASGLHRITGGNPFFLTEALATAAGTVPASVRDAVLARTGQLSPASREIAELVCVVPGRTEVWLLEQAGRPDEAGIEGCLGIGMVRHEDGSLAFRHELARRALQDSLSQPRLRSLHSKVLAVLAGRSGIPAARLAHHADGARIVEEVLRFAPIAAAQAASMGAHREAASHYQIALRYAEHVSAEERARLHEQLSYEYFLTAQHERAIEAQRAALQMWRASGQRVKEGDSLRWLSRLSWCVGSRAEANRYGIDAVAILESLPPGPELAMAYCVRADLDMEAHVADSAIDWAQRAIALAEPRANTEILSHALNTLGTVRLIGGDASGWPDLDRSLQVALAGGFQEQVVGAYTDLAAMAVSHRQYDQASRYLSAGLTYCEERDLDGWWLYMLAYRARLKFESGNWQGASEDAEAVLLDPRTNPQSRIPALRTLGHLRIRRGDPDARAPLDEARALAGPTPELQRVGMLAAAYAEAAWLADDREGVLREVQPAYELVRERQDPRMKGELAAWLWRVGALEQHPADIAEPYALEISGDWQGASRSWEALGCPYEYANMLGWYGGEAEQREALAILEQLGATPAAQLLRMKMRAQGVRGIPRGSRESTRSNSFGLTRRETQILALLSEGLRNSAIAKRLFVSTKTVDHHVSRILAKLGVPSRAEAVVMARKQSAGEV
jgi:DNA-binding CsgD family transcriptional regulator/tetratricopeptide (TPR) repeat protein